MPDTATGLSPHELERVGVFLLRHHAAAGAERVGQLEESVLVAAEDDQVLRQPAEMHHRQRRCVEEGRGEIAIGRSVHAVVDDAGEAEIASERLHIDRIRGACNRARPEGQCVGFTDCPRQTREIAAERGDM